MSSIVKAGKSIEISMDKKHKNNVNEIHSINFKAVNKQEIEGVADKFLDDLRQQRETMISTALKKSRHIDQEAEKRANATINQAQKMSRKLMDDAEKKGYNYGYSQGLLAGKEEALKAVSLGLEEIEKFTLMMNNHLEQMVRSQQHDLVNLSFAIAEKIMRQQMSMSEDAIGEMLEDILKEEQSLVRLYVSEYDKTLDLNMSKAVSKKLKENWKDAKVVVLKEDDKLMIETEEGTIDISINNQIKTLKEAVNATL